MKYVFEFTTADPRGAVACLLPEVTRNGSLYWNTEAVIRISSGEDLDDGKWKCAIRCGEITPDKFSDYQRWLISWLEQNNFYSILEGGSTVKKFLDSSLSHLGIEHLPILPQIDTYMISYKTRVECNPGEMFDITRWFQELLGLGDLETLHITVNTFSSLDYIYYCEVSSRAKNYYRISSPKFVLSSSRLSVTNDSKFSPAVSAVVTETHQDIVLPVAITSQVAVASHCSPHPVIASSRTSTGMLIIIVLVVLLIIIIFITIIYYASYSETLPSPVSSPITFIDAPIPV